MHLARFALSDELAHAAGAIKATQPAPITRQRTDRRNRVRPTAPIELIVSLDMFALLSTTLYASDRITVSDVWKESTYV
jgi:hypothetical protein